MPGLDRYFLDVSAHLNITTDDSFRDKETMKIKILWLLF